MDPAAGDEQGVARVQDDLPALGLHLLSNSLTVQRPLLVQLQVICQPEHLQPKKSIHTLIIDHMYYILCGLVMLILHSQASSRFTFLNLMLLSMLYFDTLKYPS